MNLRIIPRLDIKGPNLVKGVHLEGLRVLGKPEEFARHYYESGADELICIDTVASLYGRNNLTHIIERIAQEIFIPFTVGGGLRSIEDVRRVLLSGADKVSLNTAAIHRPELIRDLAKTFGSSTIVISIEAKKQLNGTYEAYTDNGREKTGINVFDWAMRVAELGAGEILLTSIDQEGTGTGFDLELTKRVAQSVPIPVIASGGAGKLNHILDVVEKAKADAVALASMLHYQHVQNLIDKKAFQDEGNIHFLESGSKVAHLDCTTIENIKQHITKQGVPCRFAFAAHG
jgi:imidazole glycerol-phosphate synthase subunit HisF